MNTSRQRPIAAVLAALMLAALSPAARAQDDWEWILAPYLWGAGIDTDLRTNQPPAGGTSLDTHFDGILDEVDGIFEVHAEGQGETFGMLADFTYLGLADENDRPRFHTSSDLDVRLLDAVAVWNPSPGRFTGLDLFAGLRYVDLDLAAELRPTNPAFPTTRVRASDTYSDLLLGVRYTWTLSDRWTLALHGDGSFGDTEGTWGASAILQYRAGGGAWWGGYRYLDGRLQTGDNTTDITMRGPLVGYAFRF